ncbi:hypothetical protein FPZ24_14260 [Sphingomonas panacisoli]|uniref:Uncharacterized protein n=1 Tax=Sphingomonas panacisoli TaxID=1813879 RepID=A0A5B8LN41_9SPHN|nr:hypothetical protein [Sphingomonas panacisoli]QDZ08490.1 hypothetical protein FPZ24_14260 [Sphingomonas panacisoli]
MIARFILPLLLLAAAAPAAPGRDVAGNRMLALVAVKGPAWFAAKEGERSALRCTPDRRRCMRVVQADKDWAVEIYDGVPTKPEPAVRIAITGEAEPYYVAPWQHIVEEANGHWLVGALTTQTTGYSGGGASNETLTLYDLAPGANADPPEVLNTLIGGSVMIHACFSERDMKQRAGACHDLYEFTCALTLDPATRSGRPRFRLATKARTYPGSLIRADDNTPKRMTKRNLAWARDPACSYTRTLAWNGTTYAPDRPVPECSDYLTL